jgi:DNA-directed RNA polymerase specialized sigma subunit
MEQSFQEGEEKAKKEISQISKLFIKGKKTPNEIADELNITIEKVKAALIDLGHDLD